VLLDKVPDADRELLSACRDTFVGEVLQRTKGRVGYKLKPQWYNIYKAETLTYSPNNPRIETSYGSVITDNGYHDVPLDQIVALNYQRCGYIKVPNPYQQTKWIYEGQAPTHRWKGMEGEDYCLVLEWWEIRDRAIEDNRRTLAQYRNDTILCLDPDFAIRSLRIATSRIIGRSGMNFSVEYKDRYGRSGETWGGAA